MNYLKIYEALIERAKNRILEGYCEEHHIVPRCLNGSDHRDNLVELTPEEHYLAHQLLVKIHPGNPKLIKAASMMIPNRPSNKLYGWLRRKLAEVQSEEQSGTGNSQFGTKWVTNGVIEKKLQKEEALAETWFPGRLQPYLTEKKKKDVAAAKNQKRVDYLRGLYSIYALHGFDEVKKSGYVYSQPNLVSQFAKYLPEFVPQNGKKRRPLLSS